MLFAVVLLLVEAAPALSQVQPPPPAQMLPGQPPAAQPAPPPEAPPPKSGNVFDAIGRWWDKSSAEFKQSVEENNAKWRRNVDEQNAKWRELGAKTEQASREATEAFKNLSNVKIVEGRQVCEISANGSPDCQTAAEVFCKSKGFATGKSADITTSRNCKAASLFRRETHECKVETAVIKAACQQ